MTARSPTISALSVIFVLAGCVTLDGLADGSSPDDLPPRSEACAAPSAPKCEHGRCVEDNGAAKCGCDAGWSGPTCSECAPGGPCAGASCATTKCAAHASCSDSSGAPTCTCVAGYEINASNCVWKGVLLDPSFENKPAGSWKVEGGVVVDGTSNSAGQKDPGVAELRTTTCSSARVSQAVTMPPLELAEPLALDLHGRGRCELSFPGSISIPCFSPVVMTVGARGLIPFAAFLNNALTPARACLGERAFGGSVTFGLFPGSCSSLVKSITMDRVNIVVDPSCPAPGRVTNGDFEGLAGWTVGGVGAEVAPSVGNMSSRGGRLHSTKRCESSSLTGAISVRTSQPARPALTFAAKGTIGKKLVVSSGTTVLGTYTGKSVYEKVSLCLPEHLKGMAASLTFAVASDTTSGACGDPDDVEHVFDDIAIETDATCDPATFVIDGGFERTDTARYWPAITDGGSVSFVRAAGAKTGTGYAVVTQSACDKTSRFGGIITAPEPSAGGGGPTLEFFYKAEAATAVTYNGPGGALAPTTTWTRATRCLEPRRAGVASSIAFEVSATAGCTSGSLSIDDVRVMHDPACPAQ